MKKYNELTKEEKLACISLFPEEAKKDEGWDIRRETELFLSILNLKCDKCEK